jgi:hypothetical protein
VTWDASTRTWQLVVAGPVSEPPPVVVTASVGAWGPLASSSPDLQQGATMAPPRVAWSGPTRLEGSGTFAGKIAVTPAPVPAGAPVPDGVVCLQLGEPTSGSAAVALQLSETSGCHPAGEPFAVAATVAVDGDRNGSASIVVPYTIVHRPNGTDRQLVVATGDADLPTFVLAKPTDALKSLAVAVVVMVLSALLPLLLLVWMINQQRRLPAPQTRMVAVLELLADGGAVHRPEGQRLDIKDFHRVDGTRDAYELPRGLSLVRPRTWNPFAPTIVEAVSSRGPVTVVPWMAPGAGRAVQVPAGFRFLVMIRSEPGSATAELVVVAPRDATAREVDRAVDAAIAATNGLWARVSSVLPALAST